MRILIINEVFGHTSTGKICAELAEKLEAEGNTVKVAYGRDNLVPAKYQKYAVRIGTDIDVKIHALMTRITDKHGLYSKRATQKFLSWAEKYNPDLVWLHNLHGYYINYEILFKWIKLKPQMKVQWTLHDCWAFTGHCTYFSAIGCDKWMQGCSACPQKRQYPTTLIFDNSKSNYAKKKETFTKVGNLTIITPSEWLKNLVKQGFLKEYKIDVVINRVDESVFKPTNTDFKEKHGIENKIMLLGVANIWEKRKGLDDFLSLAEMLDDRFAIVLVGLSLEQMQKLPYNVIGMARTKDQKELAEIYSAADYYINASKEETYGMTTVEAISCGTKTIVYKETACEEVVNRYGKGIAVDQGVSNIYQFLSAEIREGGGKAQI